MKTFNSYDMSFCDNKECTYKTRCMRHTIHYDELPIVYSCIMIEKYLSCGMFIDGKEENNE